MSWMSGEDGGTCVMRMPAGKHIGEAPANTLCLDISLEPSAFRALPGKDRADLLFSLARVDRSPNEIMKRLFAAGVSDTVAKASMRNSTPVDSMPHRPAPRRLPATQNPTGAQRQAKHGAAKGHGLEA